ncbi:MAG TPA: YkvA family protein [Candidatus Limnocylindrales bacterium]|nr:YkvA family protein [Candidatus Limnocylindrales bacterium]
MTKDRPEKAARSGRRSAGGAVRRALGLLAFLPVASRVPAYARLVWALAIDERTPAARKALLGGALGYLLIGRDLVPDDIPVVGGLDDLVVVALAVDLFLDGMPDGLLDEKLVDLGIDRVAFDRDVAQIRRLTPGPVRRTIRRIPGALTAVGDAVGQTGVGPRLRTWINKEESLG